MFLSEVLIWNVSVFSQVLSASFLKAGSLVLLGIFIYLVLFAVFSNIIQRFKVNDFTGIVLLGSIYGLLLEGIFADKIFNPVGFGFNVTGIWASNLAFTALSWHPLIDFFGAFFLLKILLKRKTISSTENINLKEMIVVFFFSFFWFIFSFAPWLLIRTPQGVPLFVEIIFLMFPIILVLAYSVVLKNKLEKMPEKFIGKKGYFLATLFLLFFIFLRFNALSNKLSFFIFWLILLLYIFLFLLYVKSGKKEKNKQSILEEIFPMKNEMSLIKFSKLIFFVYIFYFIFKLTALFFPLKNFFIALNISGYILLVFFAAIFPLYAILKIAYNFLKK